MSATRQHVVIIGGGFGGLYAARALAKADVEVTLIDRRNHHTFQPLLYQVATAGLNPADIAVPIRRILRRQKNVRVLLAEAESVDVHRRRVLFTGGGSVAYDHLILATGATHSYFAHPEWERFAPGLKTIEDALEMRKRIFFAFEAAEREEDPARYREWLTFVIVGAGPTGVELAGTLAEIAKKTLAQDFRRIDPTRARILLLEGSPNLLGAYVPPLRDKAKAQLESLGVEVRLDARVTAIDDGGVMLGDERVASRTVLWAAGVAASPVVKSLGAPLDRAGRVLVEPDLSIPGHSEVYVIGDTAARMQDGQLVPGVARAAIDGGRHAAANIKRALKGEPSLPFHYKDPGMLATIGRGAAIADFGKLKVSGFTAWMAWLLIHILFLIGFRNRFAVILEWAAAYLTYDRGARLITGRLPDTGTRSVAAPPSKRGVEKTGEAMPAVE
ncbi:NADH dehydrogenase [Minicystis rosea]|nr:NADH dehydrogenase [Minicystis rosea]